MTQEELNKALAKIALEQKTEVLELMQTQTSLMKEQTELLTENTAQLSRIATALEDFIRNAY